MSDYTFRRSNLSKLLHCPRALWLELQHGQNRTPACGAAMQGTLLHKAQEHYYTAQPTDSTSVFEAVVDTHEDLVEHTPASLLADTDLDWKKGIKLLESATPVLLEHLEREDSRYELTFVASESRLEHTFSLQDGRQVTLTGDPDTLHRTRNGQLVVQDLKFQAQVTPPPANDFQRLTYFVLAWRSLGEMPYLGLHDMVKRVIKEPKAVRDENYVAPAQVEAHERRLLKLLARAADVMDMQDDTAAAELDPNQGMMCGWYCGRQAECEEMDQ